MDDNNSGNFLDKNTLLAIALSILFFIGWQFYVQKKYPNRNQNSQVVKTSLKEQSSNPSASNIQKLPESNVDSSKKILAVETSSSLPAKEVLFPVDTKNFAGQLSSYGMGLKLANLKNYSDREGRDIEFTGLPSENNDNPVASVKGNFSTTIAGVTPHFSIRKEGELTYIGTANFQGIQLEKTMVFDPTNYTVAVTIRSVGGSLPNRTPIVVNLANQALKVKSTMLTPAYEGTEFFAVNDGSEERERIDIEKQMDQSFAKTSLAAIGSQYFAVALKDQSSIIPGTQFSYSPKDQVASAKLSYDSQTLNNNGMIEFVGFIGPKKYDILKNLDPELVQLINYGIFGIISKPMLSVLKWLYGLVNNWGFAIILLTILIRLMLLPINVSSLRSMKKMQKIQPQLKAIKAKYKDDPARVNQETMALMKSEKANPLGGCLPMLLQFPVFLALYSLLGQSVELYKAPFIFWIHDLSYQDPYYVLPIAVGLLYFVQMSITPQAGMDPMQAKIMKFIPLLFCFFMITVPSGLTLYFFVNTIFGIGQQFIIQKEKRKASA